MAEGKSADAKRRSPHEHVAASNKLNSAADKPFPNWTSAQALMTALLLFASMAVYFYRKSNPMILQLIKVQWNLTNAQHASLLSAFYWGYTPVQILSGAVVQHIGAKTSITVVLVGTAVGAALLPVWASFNGLWFALVLVGMCQSAWVPAKTQLQGAWLPRGEQRAFGRALISYGSHAGQLLGTWFAGVLVAWLSWPSVPWVVATMTGVCAMSWQVCASSYPEDSWVASREEKSRLKRMCVAKAPAVASATRPLIPWKLLCSKPVAAVFVMHVTSNWSGYTLTMLGPMYFREVLQVPVGQVGFWLGLSQAGPLFSGLAVAALESFVLRRGWPVMRVRLLFSLMACASAATTTLLFGLSTTAWQACLCNGLFVILVGLHSSGYSAAYIDVAGSSSAVVSGVGNTLANCPGMFIPQLALAMRGLAGGAWWPVWLLIAALNCAAALLYASWLPHTPPQPAVSSAKVKRE
eukprot:m.149344 g.149344  ORF g.149344 m.149344 type:complete len:466 (+) comp17344_c0_seq5:2248-3645(+)